MILCSWETYLDDRTYHDLDKNTVQESGQTDV